MGEFSERGRELQWLNGVDSEFEVAAAVLQDVVDVDIALGQQLLDIAVDIPGV